MRLRKLDAGVLLCFERDGASPAIQRSGHGGFFGAHDLMHYAVETTLGIRRGFLGLMSQGWEFSAFIDRADPRFRSLPWEALYTERLVDVLLRARADAAWPDPALRSLWFEDVWREVRAFYTEAPEGTRPLTEADAVRICAVFDGLLDRWTRTPVGGEIVLEFGSTGP